jgi:hypothetical protein
MIIRSPCHFSTVNKYPLRRCFDRKAEKAIVVLQYPLLILMREPAAVRPFPTCCKFKVVILLSSLVADTLCDNFFYVDRLQGD